MDWMNYMLASGRTPTPMAHLEGQRMIDRLRQQGLIKDTWLSGYKITPKGLDVARQAALDMLRTLPGAVDPESIDLSGDDALQVLRKSFRR